MLIAEKRLRLKVHQEKLDVMNVLKKNEVELTQIIGKRLVHLKAKNQ